jgi:hypothetical protein
MSYSQINRRILLFIRKLSCRIESQALDYQQAKSKILSVVSQSKGVFTQTFRVKTPFGLFVFFAFHLKREDKGKPVLLTILRIHQG